MAKRVIEINENTEIDEVMEGTILLSKKAILTILSKMTGEIFLAQDCRLIVKGKLEDCKIYADKASVVDIQAPECHGTVYLNDAWLRIENECELVGDIVSDGGTVTCEGRHTGDMTNETFDENTTK